MSDKSFWYTPRDPETRSFRWRTNRDRAAAQEAAERGHSVIARSAEQYHPTPSEREALDRLWQRWPEPDEDRDTSGLGLPDGDTRAHMWVPMVCFTVIGGGVVFLAAVVLVTLFGGSK